jgi:hypothetical protein
VAYWQQGWLSQSWSSCSIHPPAQLQGLPLLPAGPRPLRTQVWTPHLSAYVYMAYSSLNIPPSPRACLAARSSPCTLSDSPTHPQPAAATHTRSLHSHMPACPLAQGGGSGDTHCSQGRSFQPKMSPHPHRKRQSLHSLNRSLKPWWRLC